MNYRILITTPLAPISDRITSHRAAQAVIYADQIASAYGGWDVTINFGGVAEDYNEYDIVAVYHGNDWSGTVNMFGGVKAFGNIDQLARLSKFKGEVWSLDIHFPEYSKMIKPRVDKDPAAHPDWKQVDWEYLNTIENLAITKYPNGFVPGSNIAVGDSHGISMYRPGWKINSVPYKTLYGALELGLKSFIPTGDFTHAEFYFGNIDIRHHLCRQSDPIAATKDLVKRYVEAVKPLLFSETKIWEPLPIENESRKLPKTGYYKGTPFYGSWAQRNEVRKVFVEELERLCTGNISVFKWTDRLLNSAGELDFEHMEKPQSVHLSRGAYPHWQGYGWHNKLPSKRKV